MAGSCKHGNEPSFSMKYENFLTSWVTGNNMLKCGIFHIQFPLQLVSILQMKELCALSFRSSCWVGMSSGTIL